MSAQISMAYQAFADAGYEHAITILRRGAAEYDETIADYKPVPVRAVPARAVIKRGAVRQFNEAGGFRAEQGVMGYSHAPIYAADQADNGEADVLEFDGSQWRVETAETRGGVTKFEALRAPVDVSVNL